jgi:hypothetical protein
MVTFLVERGASSIAENNSGFQPWADAAFAGHQDLMTILKDYADVEHEQKFVEGKPMPERSPSSSDNPKELDEKQKPAKEETSPSKSNEALPRAPGPSETRPLRHTAMLKALAAGNPLFVGGVLGMGVSPNEPINDDQSTALDIASSYKYNNIVVKLLLARGAKTDVRDKYGNT